MEIKIKLSFHSKIFSYDKRNKMDTWFFSLYNYLFNKWNNFKIWRKKKYHIRKKWSMCALCMIFVINVNFNVNMSLKDEWPVTVIINTIEGKDGICCGCYISCCSQFVDCIVETCISPKSRFLPSWNILLGTGDSSKDSTCRMVLCVIMWWIVGDISMNGFQVIIQKSDHEL